MDRFLTADDLAKSLRNDVYEGLTGTPKTLPPKWFYDERGSALFEEITKLEEYYPTRREREILVARAAAVAEATGARTLLELGAGSGEKTRLLLDALAGTLRTYVPVDVSGDFLEEAAAGIAADHPGLDVRPVVADHERHLHLLPGGERRLVAFLGGTIGNMPPAERVGFLGGVRATMSGGDFLLLGADLVKDAGRLVRAYDDAAGVTAEFNRNVLRVINAELDADFDPDAFQHRAVWDGAEEWIEMRLRSVRDQEVRVGGLDLAVSFAAGEEMRTEISAKFRRDRLEAELGAAGMEIAEFWTDADGDFSLTLARPTG
ncbi:L-histidine N(alpha)-methyltransferase [Actinomadura livida]|uniref:Histidine N-alpha-methyltransferase n=1 Tax=Actinomadura livida TaxID=79909 RepID=A0A7W7IH62_9ACTN|nr:MULTISPECIES: L-histidine N(alpha)-methyltransferase [Actinomadura]MBB4777057.1 L-histidine N-alpha-methyltransferase [Actinomadura catellatispora]GGU37013.1 histidine N-alpha-methyltransferase [Actinomadura livida]